MTVSDDQIIKLSDYKHARLRTEMYLSSRDPHTQSVLVYDDKVRVVEETWVPAIATAFREILDNALDEVVTHGHGNRIDVTYDPSEMAFTISDDGRGIPIDFDPQHNLYLATLALTETKAGRNFGEGKGTRGMNGIGASIVNFCSESFAVEINREKQQFTQQFSEGDELQISDVMIWPTDGKKTGTKIHCKLSTQVFQHRLLPERFIASRMYEIALCYPKLHLTYNGVRVHTKPLFDGLNPITFQIDDPTFKGRFWLVPEFLSGTEFSFSLVNAIPLFNGGTHIEAFRRCFHSGLLAALERENKKRKLIPNRSDVSDGLMIYGILQMPSPRFDGQSKTRLINENVGTLVKNLLDQPEFFKDIIKKNPEWIDKIYARCAERTQARDEKEVKSQAKRNLRQKIEELEDACGLDRSKCVLFITEGKSAVSGIAEARDSSVHGALPLSGKILNVFGESAKSVLANAALSKIMNSIGLIPGQRANRYTLRYGKVYLTADSDHDGYNITALLTSFFHSFWPELFDPQKPPYFYVFGTPLLIAIKGKQRKYWYSGDAHNFDPEAMKGWEIVRAKGLAALTRDDWKHVLQTPSLVPIVDDGKLSDCLRLLFSPDADARKEWMGI